MNEEELDEIIKLKQDYEIANNYTKRWLDYVYNKKRIKFSDDYYDIKIKETFNKDKVLTIHLPTIVKAMENYTEELYKKYKSKFNEVNKEKRNDI